MTTLEIVNELRNQGHQVSYYVRKDGGILIKEIDGAKYPKGALGNTIARSMLNQKLSEARRKQLAYATRTRKEYRKPKAMRLKDADAEIKSEYKRVKDIWNKRFKAKNGKPSHAGYFGWSRISWSIEHYGREEAMRRISEAERYAEGVAYSKNVEALALFIEDVAPKLEDEESKQTLYDLAEDIRMNAYRIRDEWIYPAYEKLYTITKGKPVADIVKAVKRILRIV